jgi:penicillin amidase
VGIGAKIETKNVKEGGLPEMKSVIVKILLWAGGAVVVLAVVLAGALFFVINSSLPQRDGKIVTAGVKDDVSVFRGEYGVPRIFASDRDDAYFSLGVVHAQDRLWQMELLRRASAGRLAEIFGEGLVPLDTYFRSKRYGEHALSATGLFTDETRRALESYNAGINSVIDSGQIPLEMRILGIEPEYWAPEHSVLVMFSLSERLSTSRRKEKFLANFARNNPTDALKELLPSIDRREIETYQSLFDGGNANLPPTEDSGTGGLAEWEEQMRVTSASNIWAHSEGGKTLLANDPHLPLELPPPWYVVRIEAPDMFLLGATIPGIPFHISAQNGHAAWGATVAGADDADLIIERLNEAGTAVLRASGESRLRSRNEIIKVKDQDDVNVTIRASDQGPIVSDYDADYARLAPAGHIVALKWNNRVNLDQSMNALYELNHSRQWLVIRNKLRQVSRPILNIMYMDERGRGGVVITGAVLSRPIIGGTVCGAIPRPGWLPEVGCADSYLEDALIPSDSSTGSPLYNANQPWPDADSWRLTYERYPDIRYQRLRHYFVDNPASPSVERFNVMQNDTVAGEAQAFLEAALPLITSGTDERLGWAHETLSGWDFHMDGDSIAATLYASWREVTFSRLLEDETGGELYPFFEHRALLTARLLRDNSAICDDITTPGTESCGEVAQFSLEETLERLDGELGDNVENWRWGNAHRAILKSAFWERIPLASSIFSFEPESSGDTYTLRRGAQIYDRHWLSNQHGAAYRGIYDIRDSSNSLFALAGGNSANPFSPHWNDQTDIWNEGSGLTFPETRDQLAAGEYDLLVITPEDGN